jgi:MazG family protein
MQPSRELSRLIEIMARLRDPETGCPWDIEQDFSTIKNYTIEEAYEVADAIDRGDYDDLRDELGDLLLQPVYHAQMASERGLFDIGDVIEAVTTKMIRRHPHVFGPDAARDAEAAKGRWEAIKAEERARKAAKREADAAPPPSLLDDVPHVLPALARAEKLTKRAASVGFDWPDAVSTLGKVREELDELDVAMAAADRVDMAEEVGDLLLAVANLARQLDLDPEAALRDANTKFARRFSYVEQRARADGVPLAEAGLARLDAYWNEVRAQDREIKSAEKRE